MNKRTFTEVVGENFSIARDKFYISDSGVKVELGNLIEEMIKNTEIITQDELMYEKSIDTQKDYVVRENIINLGTIDTILKLRGEGLEGDIIALDFASAVNPGGGYLSGSKAQEESICRASMLFESLEKQKAFYGYNRENYTPLYNDRMIYVPNVPIIRNDKLELLENFKLASFIVSPAVNRKRAYGKGIKDDNLIYEAMSKRIEKILTLAIRKKPTALVLGAFGCGVFGNDREVIYNIFEKYIRKLIPKEIKVVFAVIG